MNGLTTFLKLLRISIVSGIVATFTGCLRPPDCNFKSEPALTVYIQNTLNYTAANTLKNNVPLNGSDNSFTLPIAMNATSTTYIFHAGDVTDTLELEYAKDVQFESTACGFTLRLENLQIGSLTSFSSVEIDGDRIHIQ